MKQFNIVLLAVVLVSLFGGTATAAELKVIRIGPGDGEVIGGDIDCGSFACKATYPPGTVVQLKAIPDENSTFIGWMVNGIPHQGTITIEDEDILVAAKFDQNLNLDDTMVMWYIGNHKEYATIALDHVIVFEAEVGEWDPVAYKAELQEIAARLHPQAELTDGPYFKWVKSPEPLTLAQLKQSIAAILELPYVRQVSPLLYFYQGAKYRMILTGEIVVKYPKTYTDEQIQAIEQEYGLIRLEFEKPDPFDRYFYRVEGDALHSLEIANQLYESGRVESSRPHLISEGQIGQANPAPGDPHFQDQWAFVGGYVGDIQSVWNEFRGDGIVIAMVDDGVDYLHEDLQENLRLEESYNYFDRRYAFVENSQSLQYYLSLVCPDKTPDLAACRQNHTSELRELLPYPFSVFGDTLPWRDSFHGTLVAGLAVGQGFNNLGIRGMAPNAEFVGYRVHGVATGSDGKQYQMPSLEDLPDAMRKDRGLVRVYCSALGLYPFKEVEDLPEALEKTADDQHVHVFMASNHDQVNQKWVNTNYSQMANSPYVIVVGACNSDGSAADYSIPGASVLISAPVDLLGPSGGLIAKQSTTDVTGDSMGLNAPSGSTPYVIPGDYSDSSYTRFFSGTSAATPIIAGAVGLLFQANSLLTWRDVHQILALTADTTSDSSWMTDGVHPYSHKLGFGRINIENAVEMARVWEPTGPLRSIQGESEPDDPSVITIDKNLRIESIELSVTADNPDYLTLFSPIDTTSLVVGLGHPPLQFSEWRFTSVRHFGESSKGTWRLEGPGLQSWELKIYGTEWPAWRVTQPADPICTEQGDAVACQMAQDENTITLRPTTSGQVFANSPHGTYWFPPNDEEEHKIEILANLTPQRDWFDIPPFEPETVSIPCEADSPATDEETYTADWWLEWQEIWFDDDARGCRASFVVEGTEIVAVEIESPAGCDTVEQPEPSSGTLTATVMTDWSMGGSQETGVWKPVEERPGGVEYAYEKTCKMYYGIKSIFHIVWGGHWGETWLYFYGCNTRDPWPPAEPDAQSFCPPPTDEDLHDLTQSPPSRICTDVEVEDFVEFEPYPSDTWREWDACTGYLKDCWMEGGGQYPIKLTIEKEIIWEKEIATCTTEYGKTEHFRVSPDTTTLPESLGVIGVDESSGSEPPAG